MYLHVKSLTIMKIKKQWVATVYCNFQMSTTLSTQNNDSLRQLASLDDATIKKIAEATFQSFIDPEYKSSDLNENEAKAQIGLATLISLYVRQGTFADSLSAVLKDNGVSQTSVQTITDLYKDKVDLMRAHLSNVAFSYPRIVGCEEAARTH